MLDVKTERHNVSKSRDKKITIIKFDITKESKKTLVLVLEKEAKWFPIRFISI
jgi:hypothetical protein